MSSPNFDRIAPFYDFLAQLVFGRAIRESQIYYLNQIPDQARVLILGGGTGWILEEIPNKNLHIDYVDLSKKMLTRAKRRPVSFKTLRFIQGNQDSVKGQSYDVVITPFVLDVCTEEQLPKMVNKIAHLVAPNGHWLCIDFNVHDLTIKAQCLNVLMRYFFRTVSGLKLRGLLPYFKTIEHAGFTEISSTLFYGRFIQASLFKRL